MWSENEDLKYKEFQKTKKIVKIQVSSSSGCSTIFFISIKSKILKWFSL